MTRIDDRHALRIAQSHLDFAAMEISKIDNYLISSELRYLSQSIINIKSRLADISSTIGDADSLESKKRSIEEMLLDLRILKN